jgi:hypothetical protein
MVSEIAKDVRAVGREVSYGTEGERNIRRLQPQLGA